jgi:hypothetical protein
MKRRYLGMSFIIGYCLLLIIMVTACCCTTNQAIDQVTGDDAIVSTTGNGVMSTQSVKPVKIVYFEVKKALENNPSLPMRSVKLIWQIKHADEARTRLDDHWVPSTGHEWVQVPAGVEIPFRLVAHGVDGSVDIRIIQVLAR